jgi:putative ABC transport system permease protein
MRATRSTVGLLVATTLITTFGVATRTFEQLLTAAARNDPEYYAGIDPMFSLVTAVFSALIGVSALIAAVGLVNALSLGVLQRTRELGLLRALGFSAAQLRRMVLTEAGQLVIAAVVLGLLLGTGYGWAGAESMLGSVQGSPGLVAPAIPWALVAVIVVAAAALTLVASVAPSRRATRIVPIEALLAD